LIRTAIVCAIYGSIDSVDINPTTFKTIMTCLPQQTSILNLILSFIAKYYSSTVLSHYIDSIVMESITPLCLASYLGKTDLVKLLIAYGANVDAQDLSHSTPLMYACIKLNE
jgi:hypothetical protein